MIRVRLKYSFDVHRYHHTRHPINNNACIYLQTKMGSADCPPPLHKQPSSPMVPPAERNSLRAADRTVLSHNYFFYMSSSNKLPVCDAVGII